MGLVGGAGLVVACLALYFTRESTLHPLLVRIAPSAGRLLAGMEVEIRDIEGDWHRELSVTGLRIVPLESEGSVLQRFEAAEVAVTGDLLALWRRRVQDIETLRVLEPSLALDLSAPAKTNEPQPEPLEIPELPTLDVQRGSVEVQLASGKIEFAAVRLQGAASAVAPLRLEGDLSGPDWRARVEAGLTRTGPNSIAFTAALPAGEARGVELSAEGLAGSWSPGETRLLSGVTIVGANRVTASGVVFRSGDEGMEAGGLLKLDLPDLGDAHRAACALRGVEDAGGWSGSATGTVDLQPAPGRIATGEIELNGNGLILAGIETGVFSALATADETGLVVHEIIASDGDSSQIRGSGTLSTDGQQLKDVELTIRLDEPELVWEKLKGARGVLAELALSGSVKDPEGTLKLRAKGYEASGLKLTDLTVDGSLAGGRLTLRDAAATTEFGQATGAATVGLPIGGRSLDVLVEGFRWEEGPATLELAEPVPIVMTDDSVQIDGLRLTSGTGSADLSFRSQASEGWALDLSVAALELEPFLAHLEAAQSLHFGALNGTAKVTSQPEDGSLPHGHVDLTLERSADFSEGPVAARLKATWENESIVFEELIVELEAAQLQLAGTAPLGAGERLLPPGDLSLRGNLSVDAQALNRRPLNALMGAEQRQLVGRASGRTFATVDLKGAWDALRGTVALDLENARIEPEPGKEPLLPEAVSGRLAITLGDSITLDPSGVELGSIAKAVVSGSLQQSLSLKALLDDPAARLESWRSVSLALDAELDFRSLDWLARFMPELRETSGELTGSAAVRGTAAAPEASGQLRLADGSARYRGLPPLENANVEITVTPEQLRIDRATLEVGAAPVELGGTALLGQGQPRIDATIRGSEVLLARSSDARIRGDLDLRVTGRTNALKVGGAITLVGGRVRSPIEFQSLLAGGSTQPQAVRRGVTIASFGPESVALDIAIRTSEALTLRGRIARGKIRTDLRLTGTADHPTPIGQLYFDPLELAVPAGTILFPTGLVRFEPDAPDIPKLDLVGTTTLAGYAVTVNVDGDYDAPNVDLSSSPPLAPEDLLLLVLSGQPPSQGGGIEAAGQSVALYVAKDLVRGWFSSGGFEDEDKESFLDRLEVTTGRDVSRSGTLTLEATYKLRQGFARERDALYVVLERDAYEDYGLGLRLVLRLR